jgi:hypothetical protein
MDAQPLFRCLLDEQPAEFVAGRVAAEQPESPQVNDRLRLNPDCWFSRNGPVRVPFLERFSRDPETIWILDPATNALLPF